MANYYDRDGRPITDVGEFARLFSDLTYKRILVDTVDGADVSTVWLGINHNYTGEGPPLIFETMIFGGDHDQDCWRYATEEEARKKHDEIVAALKAGVDPWDD